MSGFKRLGDLAVGGKRVLVRVDLNVPMQDGKVTDATRIERAAATMEALSDRGARVVLLSHFGRPKGARIPEMSLKPLVAPLSAALGGKPVAFAEDCVGDDAAEAVAALPEGGVLLLENLRFHAGEEKNDPAFVAQLGALGDLFVNDAFSAAHRAHASTEGLARQLPSAAGLLMQAELEALDSALGAPKRPVMAVVGGAKVSTKIDLLKNLVTRVDMLAIGGGMANTFLYADGHDVGRSLCEKDLTGTVAEIRAAAGRSGCEILLQEDAVVAGKLEAGTETRTVPVTEVPADQMILDIGAATIERLETAIASAATLVWNGPLGAFEIEPFDVGTNAVALSAAKRTGDGGLLTVAGGGDTVAALAKAGAVDRFSYVSTAGGAFLEWLEGKTLPGVAALQGS